MNRSFSIVVVIVFCLMIIAGSNESVAQNNASIHRPSRSTNFPAFDDARSPTPSSVDNNTTAFAEDANAENDRAESAMTAPMVTVCSSLAVVLGLFAALVWVTRKYSNRGLGGGQIPTEVVQSLGSTNIDPRTRLTMLRVGNRILLLSQTANGITPLSEITDADEVRQLTAVCTGESKQQFASTLEEMGREPAKGFAGPAQPVKKRQKLSLFATA